MSERARWQAKTDAAVNARLRKAFGYLETPMTAPPVDLSALDALAEAATDGSPAAVPYLAALHAAYPALKAEIEALRGALKATLEHLEIVDMEDLAPFGVDDDIRDAIDKARAALGATS